MSAQHGQSKLRRRIASGSGFSRLTGSAPDRSSRVLTEVVSAEPAFKRALAPLARVALTQGVAIVCEILPGVGRFVLGSRRQLTDLVGLATSQAIALCRRGEVRVRIARQHSGFAPTDTVLLTVSIHDGDSFEDVMSAEVSLPLAEDDEEAESDSLRGKRVLLAVATAHDARIQTAAATRFGADVECVRDANEALARLGSAHGAGKRFDVLYVDEAAPGAEALLVSARDVASLGTPFLIVGSILDDASKWTACGAEATLSKPVLPFELCDALNDAVRAAAPPDDLVGDRLHRLLRGRPCSNRRPSGVQPVSLGLAAAIARVAVERSKL